MNSPNTEYNDLGQVITKTVPAFGSGTNGATTYSYDAVGRVKEITHPDHALNPDGSVKYYSKTLYCYSGLTTRIIDPNLHMKRETRDAYGRLIQVDEYTGAYQNCATAVPAPYASTFYEYDALGNLKKVTDSAGNLTTMRYDSLSRKIAMSDPDMGSCGNVTTLIPNTSYPWYAAPCWNYEYDSAGNLTRQTDAKGRSIFFQYDSLNRVVQKDYVTQKTLGGGDVRYDYDLKYVSAATDYPVGRLTRMTDPSGVTAFGYDKLGRSNRTERTINNLVHTLLMGYDLVGRVTSVTYPDADVVKYVYNGPFLHKVTDAADVPYATYLVYNPLGGPTSVNFGNRTFTNFTYNGDTTECPRFNFRLCKIQTFGTATFQDLKFTHQNNGNIVGITDTLVTGGLHINQTQTFTYDDLNRLKTANGAYGAAGANVTLTYAYNSIGNMTCNSALSPCNETTPNYTYVDAAHKHAVTNAGGTGYTYDANGNMTGRSTDTLTYDDENRLTSVTNAGGTTTFVYDGAGNRVKKISGSVTKIYIGKYFECFVNVVDCKNSGAWTGTKHIFAGSTRIASKPITTTPGEIRYYHPDHLGSTSAVTDQARAVQGENFYQPFGETLTNGVEMSYKFTGQERDAETALYFYNARYYDPRIGRFGGSAKVS